jgi:hypothetical protein
MPEVAIFQPVFKRLYEDITDEYYENNRGHDFRPIITKPAGISAYNIPCYEIHLYAYIRAYHARAQT